MFPAGDPRFSTTYLSLPLSTGMHTVRAIECGDANPARTVLCVHGWACSVYSYRRLMPLLAERGMRAIAIDLPGHGLSEKPDDPQLYTLDALVGCVIATLDELGIERCVLVGHSMGGPICARAAVVAPGRVGGLALLAPAGFGTAWDLRILRAITPRFLAPLLPNLVHRWMISTIFSVVYGPLYRPTRRDVDEYWAPSQFGRFLGAMWDLLHTFEWDAGLDRDFGSISVPTAILDGARDNLVVRRWVRRYSEVILGATLTVIEDCGHVVPEEAPELVAGAIEALIR